MARKKRKKPSDHMDESWLLPYSDLLTLLLALFIVLFSMSNIDAKKFAEFSSSFSSALSGGTGVMDNPSPIEVENPKTVGTKDAGTDARNKEEAAAAKKAVKEKRELQNMQSQIDTYIEDQQLNQSLQTTLTDEGLRITILDRALFDSGSATVKPESIDLARELSDLLVSDTPRKITVAGFTDNVPIGSANFDSNWDLSAMRAINFMKIVLENPSLDPANFSAQGYGEYKPVASNDTPEGKAQNRRVEVLVQPNVDLEAAKTKQVETK